MKHIYRYETAVCEVDFFSGQWVISNIYVPEPDRMRGYGGKVLQMALDVADEENRTLHLVVSPPGPRGMSEPALIRWYASYGFEMMNEKILSMRRKPVDNLDNCVENADWIKGVRTNEV